ncbi:unnamed protein product, partial [Iphiclides podalirius]
MTRNVNGEANTNGFTDKESERAQFDRRRGHLEFSVKGRAGTVSLKACSGLGEFARDSQIVGCDGAL